MNGHSEGMSIRLRVCRIMLLGSRLTGEQCDAETGAMYAFKNPVPPYNGRIKPPGGRLCRELQWGALMERMLIVGGMYRHFKGKCYRVLCAAKHSETMEGLVVYQALYGAGEIYARPYGMFMAEVEDEKYPDAG